MMTFNNMRRREAMDEESEEVGKGNLDIVFGLLEMQS